MNCWLSYRHWNFLLIERLSASEKKTLLLMLKLWVFKKLPFEFFGGSFVVILSHSTRFPQSSQGSSTLNQIRTIKHKIVFLTCKTRVTKWGFPHRALLFSLFGMLRNFPHNFARWRALNMLLWQRHLCAFVANHTLHYACMESDMCEGKAGIHM
jgi:hypothetical protein